MPVPDPRLIDLPNRSGHAHHQAILEVDGWNPGWPIWFAEYLWEPIQGFLLREVTRGELTYAPVEACKELAEGKTGRICRREYRPVKSPRRVPPTARTHLHRDLPERTSHD